MKFYLNEASIHGQFADTQEFRVALEAILAGRSRSTVLAAMRTVPELANRPVLHDQTFRQVVQTWRGSPLAGSLLAWVGKNGPFVHDDRLLEEDDLFHCLGVEVTDGGLGEAGRRAKASENSASMSFRGGDPDFAQSPLPIVHGFLEEPFGTYSVENFWDVDDAIAAIMEWEKPANNWQEMIEIARVRFPNVLLPDTLYRDVRIAREPFSAVIRDQFYVLLGFLNEYMKGRDENGQEGPRSRAILKEHFKGRRALFSPESSSNKDDFRTEMTFPNPDGAGMIFAHWHGKISHRFFRMHFEWPTPAATDKVKVLYVGPKLTKA
ncbi:MAG TPA: hypothetical protein DD390_11250 [Rhodospirillaceae bacterium]|nr:hypothetical protein [Rhodospirillaceae bacterium]MAX62837.1 hypothetical protein [Rhodospirillaceae bacterium]MBB57682.1 hypothetical protein [Rhodospirillaceae bacterium]HBM13260.1 hypothetical protein [Rhodospirillaceae bacterium]